MNPLKLISRFKVTDKEWLMLEKSFGKLCVFQTNDFLSRNTKTNHTDDYEDVLQEAKQAVLIAALYHKRQTYIKKCIDVLCEYEMDKNDSTIFEKLKNDWENKTKHGAKRQRFGIKQEISLDNLVQKYVPNDKKPDPKSELEVDFKFAKYCKQISWNRLKTMGKKITKERSIRSGSVSINEFDYVASSK